MKKIAFVLGLILLQASSVLASDEFRLTSPQIAPGSKIAMEQVFSGFGCTGQNISPQLNWTGVPKGTKSFALTVYDPDAPTGSGWWHWVMFNIPAKLQSLPKNAGNPEAGLAPSGSVQSRTDFGKPGFGGPCPPKGNKPHRYIFTLHALKIDKLPLDEKTPAAMVGYYLHMNTIAKTVLQARYSR